MQLGLHRETNGGGYLAREPRRRLEEKDKEKYNTQKERERKGVESVENGGLKRVRKMG